MRGAVMFGPGDVRGDVRATHFLDIGGTAVASKRLKYLRYQFDVVGDSYDGPVSALAAAGNRICMQIDPVDGYRR